MVAKWFSMFLRHVLASSLQGPRGSSDTFCHIRQGMADVKEGLGVTMTSDNESQRSS